MNKYKRKMRKWIWLGIWILSVVGISFHGGAVSYGFFFMLTLLPVVSFVYLLCVYLRFKIYQEVESRDMVCGQVMPYFFVLRNEDYFGFASVNVRMFPDFSYVENVPEDIEYELLPGDQFTYHTQMTCKYRGEYEVGVKEVIVTDFFGIFRFRYRVPGTIMALVKPRLVEVTELFSMPEMAEVLPRNTQLLRSELDVVVRDYVMGDSLKRIHWKASAREQQLKVRQETGEEKQGITVFFDAHRYYDEPEEYLPLESKMLEVVLALGLFFAKRDMPISVCYGQRGMQHTDVTNVKSFEHFYGQMSEIVFGEEEALEQLQRLYDGDELRKSKAVIGIIHKIDDDIMHLTDLIAARECMVMLYVVSDENLEAYIRQSHSRRKIVAIPIEAEVEGLL